MKHDPTDPAGEYYRESRHSYELNDVFGDQGGTWHEVGTMDDPRGWHGRDPMLEPGWAETITDKAIKLLREREEAGYETYNKALWGDEKTAIEWLTEAIEECADQLQYLLAVKYQLEREE